MVLLKDVAPLWFAEHKSQVAESTWRASQVVLEKYMLPLIGGADLLRFNKRRLDDYRRATATAGVKPITFRRHLYVIYGILNYAVRTGQLDAFPDLKSSYPKVKPTINRPDGQKLSRLLAEQRGETSALIILLAWQLGLMRTEIQALTWEQVDYSQSCIRLSDHTVPLPQHAADVLSDLQAEQAYTPGSVVRSVHGAPITREYISMLTHKALSQYDMPNIRLMDLRHDFVIRSLRIYSPVEVAAMIGLKNPDDLLRLYREYMPDNIIEPLILQPTGGKVGRDILISRMSALTNLTQVQCRAVLEAMLSVITQALSNQETVEVQGFGSFSIKMVKERPRRDFHKNEIIMVPAHNTIIFTPDGDCLS